MKNTEIIYFDIDGTLYNNDLDIIEPEIFSALKILQSRGYKVALCTGRTLDGLKTPPILNEVKWDGYVLANGAQVFDKDMNQLLKVTMKADYVEEMINITPGPLFIEGDQNFITDAADQAVIKGFAYFGDGESNLPPVKKYQGDDVYKLVNFHVDQLELGENNPIFDQMSIITNAAGVHEIYPKNMSKYEGIKVLNQHYQLSSYAAFGDGNNDFEFLRHADYAVAMGNSPQKLKDIADYVTKDVKEQGVLYALRQHQMIE